MIRVFYMVIGMFVTLLDSTVCAQSAERPRVERHQTVYHLLTNLSHEFGVGRKSSIEVSGPISFGFTDHYRVNYDYLNDMPIREERYEIDIRPAITGTYRYYYNLDKRQRKGRRTDRNSGNFLGFEATFLGPSLIQPDGYDDQRFATTAGPVWGIQRTYGKRFNFRVTTGLGLGVNPDGAYVAFLGGVAVGFRLGKNRESDRVQ